MERGGIRGPIYSRRKKERNEPRFYIADILETKINWPSPPFVLLLRDRCKI